jgi:hypothetical protein
LEDEVNDRYKKLYSQLRDLKVEVTLEPERANDELRAEGLKGYVDAAYAIFKMEQLIDEIRKQVKKRRETYERIVCIAWLQQGTGESIKTEYVTANPDTKNFITYPKSPDEVGYREMMRDLGVAEETIEKGIIKPDFNQMKEYVSDLMARGEPVPAWSATEVPHTEYRLRYFAHRKEVDSQT